MPKRKHFMIAWKPKASPYPYPHPDDWTYIDIEADSILREMSYSRRDVINKLTRYDDPLFKHLLKLFYFRDNTRDFRGWTVTVHKCAFDLPTIKSAKGKNYRLSSDAIFNAFWGRWEDNDFSIHDSFIDDFNDKSDPEYTDLPYIYKGGCRQKAGLFLQGYYRWLGDNLSEKEKITLPEVQDEIKLLLDKFPCN